MILFEFLAPEAAGVVRYKSLVSTARYATTLRVVPVSMGESALLVRRPFLFCAEMMLVNFQDFRNPSKSRERKRVKVCSQDKEPCFGLRLHPLLPRLGLSLGFSRSIREMRVLRLPASRNCDSTR